MDTPIELNGRQQAIALPEKDVLVGDGVSVSGWGAMGHPATQSTKTSKLMKMETKIVSNAYCKDRHQLEIHSEHVCTFSQDGQGICSVS